MIYRIKQEFINSLQNDARNFLTSKKMNLGRIEIIPKEIETYYYNEYDFKDNSVHRNDLQRNNVNHFYVHRWGKTKQDSYKGGNYAGIDFVVSDNQNEYYSYLIRSAVINGKPIIGPHNVLLAIVDASGLNYSEIENEMVTLVSNNISNDVFFSHRINLGKTVSEEYRNCELRAVLCDEFFKGNKYPYKEKMIYDFLVDKVTRSEISVEQALDYAKLRLGYIPSKLRNL